MICLQGKNKCCGCAACMQVCPKHCISFEEDDEGFSYPQTDNLNCINCHLCEKVCPFINQKEPEEPLIVYAQKNKDVDVRLASSSGGVFSLLAEKTIRNGGVVFGAVFDEKWEVRHSYTDSIEGLSLMRTSKYVQSHIGSSFLKVKEFLMEGRNVMFVGTSCQIAGLNLFLKKDFPNLLTVDFICHGVPSPKVWRMYLERLKTKFNRSFRPNIISPYRNSETTIKSINFRDKRLGWKKFSLTVLLERTIPNKKAKSIIETNIFSEDIYMRSFLSNLNLRPSCYNCPAKNGKSNSDITLADFWGIEKQLSYFDDDKGVSLTIVHTRKGLNALDNLNMDSVEMDFSKVKKINPSYVESVLEPAKRNVFFNRIAKKEDLAIIVKDLLKTSAVSEFKHDTKKTLIVVLGKIFNKELDVTSSIAEVLRDIVKR